MFDRFQQALLLTLLILLTGCKPGSGSNVERANDFDKARVLALRFVGEHIDPKKARIDAPLPESITSVYLAYGIKPEFWLVTDGSGNVPRILESKDASDPTSHRYRGKKLGLRSTGAVVRLDSKEWEELMSKARKLEAAPPATPPK